MQGVHPQHHDNAADCSRHIGVTLAWRCGLCSGRTLFLLSPAAKHIAIQPSPDRPLQEDLPAAGQRGKSEASQSWGISCTVCRETLICENCAQQLNCYFKPTLICSQCSGTVTSLNVLRKMLCPTSPITLSRYTSIPFVTEHPVGVSSQDFAVSGWQLFVDC